MTTSDRLRPIFTVGSGRSGTTLVLRLLAAHPDLAWISPLTDRTGLPALAALSRVPAARRLRALRPASEAVASYRRVGLTEESLAAKGSRLDAADLSESMRDGLQRLVAGHQRAMGRPRFLSKNTANTMRAELLAAAFPGARFVHVVRNGYAVAASLSKVGFWDDLHLWWLGTTPRRWEQEHPGRHRLELCALHWSRQVSEMLDASRALPTGSYHEVRYEDLVTEPGRVAGQILSACRLEDGGVATAAARIGVDAERRMAWREELDDEAVAAVRSAAGDLLSRLGYESARPGAGD